MMRKRFSDEQLAAAIKQDQRGVSVKGCHPFQQVSQRLRYCTHMEIGLRKSDAYSLNRPSNARKKPLTSASHAPSMLCP